MDETKKTAVMQITIYDEDSEVKRRLVRSFVPWRLLKKAVRLSKELDMENIQEEDIDALASLVVEVFSDQVSVEELNNGCDIEEMVAVLRTIVSKAGNALGNPTRPASPRANRI